MTRWFVAALTLSMGWCVSALASDSLHRYWPRFPRPETVLTVTSVPSREIAIVLDTLSGLAAREALDHGGKEMIWAPLAHPSYERWYAMMLEQTGARAEGPSEIWDLVRRFKERGIVKGYILYHYDDSKRGFFEEGPMDATSNVATSLCAMRGAIAVSDTLEGEARALGLACLQDVRGMSEEECYAKYGREFSRTILALQDPKANEIRSEAVALGSFVLSKPGPLYERVLGRLKPDTPVLGWGIGDEMAITRPASEFGHFITATNWCHNLPLLSTEQPGATFPVERLRAPQTKTMWDLSWEEGVHYATFVMSDGDNVQWLMGDFVEDASRCYWSDPRRGTRPIGWTCCYVDLAQLCPYTLDYLFRTATPQDDFVLYGGGYYYPDLFGSRGGGASLMRTHARRIGQYMRLGGIRSLAFNAAQWDSDAAMRAYTACAEEIPGLLGVFTVQYAPYTAGGGAVRWVKGRSGEELPVVSARYSIWSGVRGERDNSPCGIARNLNGLPRLDSSPSDDAFSWVVVHAWSWFRPGQDDEEMDQRAGGQPGSARGYTSVCSCVDALGPEVRVVTPTEFLLRMRLMLRPEQTLEGLMAEVDKDLQLAGGRLSGEKRAAVRCHRTAAFRHLKTLNFSLSLDEIKKSHRLLSP